MDCVIPFKSNFKSSEAGCLCFGKHRVSIGVNLIIPKDFRMLCSAWNKFEVGKQNLTVFFFWVSYFLSSVHQSLRVRGQS